MHILSLTLLPIVHFYNQIITPHLALKSKNRVAKFLKRKIAHCWRFSNLLLLSKVENYDL